MPRLLLDFPIELQLLILKHLTLMEVCKVMVIPELEAAIVERLPRDKLEIASVSKVPNSGSFGSYYINYSTDVIDYNGRSMELFSNFVISCKQWKYIDTLAIKCLSSVQVGTLFNEHIMQWERDKFKNIQIHGIAISLNWKQFKTINDEYSRSSKFDAPWGRNELLRELKVLHRPEIQNRTNTFSSGFNARTLTEDWRMLLEFSFFYGMQTSCLKLEIQYFDTQSNSFLTDSKLKIFGLLIGLCGASQENLFTSEMRTVGQTLLSFASGTNLCSLSMYGGANFFWTDLGNLKNLKELSLIDITNFDSRIILPNLTKLEIQNDNCTINELPLVGLPQLETLILGLENSGPLTLIDLTHHIKFIDIKDLGNRISPSLIIEPERRFSFLAQLKLKGLSADAMFPDLVTSCPFLEALSIDLTKQPSSSIVFSQNLPQSVKKLALVGKGYVNSRMDFSGLLNLRELRIFKTDLVASKVSWGKSIETLELGNVTISDEKLIIGDGLLSNLQELKLYKVSLETALSIKFPVRTADDDKSQRLSKLFGNCSIQSPFPRYFG